MLKKTLLTTASAVVATCGIMTIASTSAQAGQLKVRMHDVNVECRSNKGLVDNTVHKDADCHKRDVNKDESPGGSDPHGTGGRSLDKGYIHIVKPEGTFSHVAIADERDITPETPASGLYEVDLYEIEDGATFSPTIKVEIELSGSANPMFKADANCVDVLRAGSDNVFSNGAFKPAPSEDADGGVQAGKMRAVCFISTTQASEGRADSAIGFALPINSKACGDLTIAITTTRYVEGVGAVGAETVSHLFQECKDSILSDSGFYPVKVDYFEDFRSFLIDPYPHDGIEEHVPSLWATTGALGFKLIHNLTDLKETDKDSEENVFDIEDIERYELTVAFEDLQGIAEVRLGGMLADLDYDEDTASWDLSPGEFASKFCINDWDGEKGSMTGGCYSDFTIHAFGPKSNDVNNGPIAHQSAYIVNSDIILTEGESNPHHPVPFLDKEEEQEGAKVAELHKTGIIFGPFDWVADYTKPVRSFFRLTGVPDVASLPGDSLKGSIEVSNSSKGANGIYKVDFTDLVNNGEVMLGINKITELMVLDGMPDDEFGRADLTFTFYVDGERGKKMDMDRLLYTNGVFASYGDNSNDAFSLKARSCDDGRFGPHVANKLDPFYKYLLTEVCSIGELSRYGIYVPTKP